MSNEVKVGAFTVCGMVLLALMLLGLSGATIFGPRQYTLYTTFPEVIGLNPAAEVRFAGVLAGKVESVSGVVDRSTGTVQVRAVFANPEKLLSISISFRRRTPAFIWTTATGWRERPRRAWRR